MSKRKANGVQSAEIARRRIPPSTWEQERDAMRDLAVLTYRVAIGLPVDSPTRLDMLHAASRWAAKAGLRGMECPVDDELGAAVDVAERLAAERVLAA